MKIKSRNKISFDKIAAISDAIISDPDTVKIQMLKEYAGKGVEILSTEKFLMELDNGD